jgi:hypothetical protein
MGGGTRIMPGAAPVDGGCAFTKSDTKIDQGLNRELFDLETSSCLNE